MQKQRSERIGRHGVGTIASTQNLQNHTHRGRTKLKEALEILPQWYEGVCENLMFQCLDTHTVRNGVLTLGIILHQEN